MAATTGSIVREDIHEYRWRVEWKAVRVYIDGWPLTHGVGFAYWELPRSFQGPLFGHVHNHVDTLGLSAPRVVVELYRVVGRFHAECTKGLHPAC